ncbi:MAG: CbiX/SirB N-terminal domain-containing protein [Armatimonadetes bacterium]|nr:CbiX/SirB N-terminal domain-containing protein [Armatimonadota bacterium]
MDALLLFSHGSLLCGAGESLENHAETLRQRGDFSPVVIGYLNYSEPTFADAVQTCVDAGAKRIVIVPYFLITGYFVTKSLPEKIAEAKAAHLADDGRPGIEFTVAEAFNFHESLADALWESATAARSSEAWREPLQAAASACRPSPECPLYGTPACPKVPVPPGE